VAASLAAGNACVVKPPEDASLALLEIAQLCIEAGLPAGALNIVTGLGPEAGAALAAHPGVDHISFTGSPETGTRVAQAAAAHHCPVTLELGGKSPQIVFADADLDAAVPVIVNAIIQNAGQTCSAGSRLLIERPVYEDVLTRASGIFTRLVCGAADKDVDVGPLVNAKQLDRVQGYVKRAQAEKVRCVATGAIAPGTATGGYYQIPMLLADVPAMHTLAQEEIFGPVLVAMPFDNEAEAIALANATQYGLVAGVWTRDGGRQLRMAKALQSGQVFINDFGAGGGVELPFGGVKKSGHGREKGWAGLLSFTTLKTVAIRHG
jgi:aldehyde dehydrogenase (NAD+)